MEIFTSERYEDGLYLITTDNFTGLVNMTFLSKENSIKEYEDWYSTYYDNVIPISDKDMTPQYIYTSSMNVISNITEIAKSELEKSNLKEEDVLIPFMGGVKGFNFQDFCNRLWDLDTKDHYKYIAEIRIYYRELFEKIELKTKEEQK